MDPKFEFSAGERSASIRHDILGRPYLHIVDGSSVHSVKPKRGSRILQAIARADWANRDDWHLVATTAVYLADDLTLEERRLAQDACAHLGWKATAKALGMRLETLQRVIFHKDPARSRHHRVRAWLRTVGDVPRLPRAMEPLKEVLCDVLDGEWRIPECPFCGSTHHHGASPGSRAAHCRFELPDGASSYSLVARLE